MVAEEFATIFVVLKYIISMCSYLSLYMSGKL